MSVTPKHGNEYDSKFDGLTYIQYCSYFRNYEPKSTPTDMNKGWSEWVKCSRM